MFELELYLIILFCHLLVITLCMTDSNSQDAADEQHVISHEPIEPSTTTTLAELRAIGDPYGETRPCTMNQLRYWTRRNNVGLPMELVLTIINLVPATNRQQRYWINRGLIRLGTQYFLSTRIRNKDFEEYTDRWVRNFGTNVINNRYSIWHSHDFHLIETIIRNYVTPKYILRNNTERTKTQWKYWSWWRKQNPTKSRITYTPMWRYSEGRRQTVEEYVRIMHKYDNVRAEVPLRYRDILHVSEHDYDDISEAGY